MKAYSSSRSSWQPPSVEEMQTLLPQFQFLSLVSPPATNAWSQVAFPYQTNATHISITAAAVANRYYRLRKQ